MTRTIVPNIKGEWPNGASLLLRMSFVIVGKPGIGKTLGLNWLKKKLLPGLHTCFVKIYFRLLLLRLNNQNKATQACVRLICSSNFILQYRKS